MLENTNRPFLLWKPLRAAAAAAAARGALNMCANSILPSGTLRGEKFRFYRYGTVCLTTGMPCSCREIWNWSLHLYTVTLAWGEGGRPVFLQQIQWHLGESRVNKQLLGPFVKCNYGTKKNREGGNFELDDIQFEAGRNGERKGEWAWMIEGLIGWGMCGIWYPHSSE